MPSYSIPHLLKGWMNTKCTSPLIEGQSNQHPPGIPSRKERRRRRRRAREKRNRAAVAAMASALCTFSLPSSSLSCSNQPGVSSFSSRCSDVLGDGSRPFHQLGCQTELADSTAGIVAQPRASKSPHSSPFFFFFFFPLLPSCERYIPCVSPAGPKELGFGIFFALGL